MWEVQVKKLRRALTVLGLMLLCAACFGVAAQEAIASPDSLVNFVQWPASEGGNDHWYGVIPTAQYWQDAVTTAAAQTHDGLPGYLATITSAEENAFIVGQIIVGLTPPTILPQYWLGGKDPWTNRWQWITGEAWGYTNWASGEPNNQGVEVALCMIGNNHPPYTPGTWNNALPDDSIHTLHQWWSIVEFGTPDVPPPPEDTLINLVQWPVSEGGNDHWYAIIPVVQPWVLHHDLARTFVRGIDTGYLATITSPAENDFVKSVIVNHTDQPSIADQFYLGGHKSPLTGWGWMTGESWLWTNWSSGEPSGDGPAMGIWGASTQNFGRWNDVPRDTTGTGPEHQLWALIEFGPCDTTQPPPPPPDSLINLVQWPAVMGGNDHWYGVIPKAQYWVDANTSALQFEHEGLTGYLATITSSSENLFIAQQVIAGLNPPTILPQFWLGGRDLSVNQWRWLTQEPWIYANWAPNEPNNQGIETALCMLGGGMSAYGKWNNALPDGQIHTLHQWWSIVEFGEPDSTVPPPPTDTVIALTQWPAAAGGNDHWYGIIPIVQPWVNHNALAQMLVHEGQGGYLTTITTPEENGFVKALIDDYPSQPSIVDQFYLGGMRMPTGWGWLTGEAWSYANWNYGEPSGDGPALGIWGVSTPYFGKWNDVPEDTTGRGPVHQLWALVEFGPSDTTTPPPPPPDSLVHLVQWRATDGGNDHWYAVNPRPMYWQDARLAAAAFEQEGYHGYLATVTSPQENQFILGAVIGGLSPNTIIDEYWLGGTDVAVNQWRWLTGEAFAFTNWNMGEPNNSGIETALAIYGATNNDPRRIPGQWNNALPDGQIHTLHQWWSIVEFGEPDSTVPPPPHDTVIALTQWPAAAGGNDHWYGIIPIVQPWVNHNALAQMLVHEGQGGYLATITTPHENSFVMSLIGSYTQQPSVADEFYLGGYRTSGTWGWLTGESWGYVNWDYGEPSGDGPALAMWGASRSDYGTWNDVPEDTVGIGPIHQLWALVEFGPMDTTTPPPPPPSGNWLLVPSVAGQAGKVCGEGFIEQPVQVQLVEPMQAAVISLDIPSQVEVCDVSFDGLVTDDWNIRVVDADNDSGFVVVALLNTFGEVLPVGTTTLFNIRFNVPTVIGSESFFIHWDTALSAQDARRTVLIDMANDEVYPQFDYYRDSTYIFVIGAPGDFDGNSGRTVADLTYLVSYLFRSGPGTYAVDLMDVNSDCAGPNIGDLVYYVNFLFRSGDEPSTGCISFGKEASVGESDLIQVHSLFDGRATTIEIESAVDLWGVQLEVSGAVESEPALLAGGGLEMVYGAADGVTKLGVLDLDGPAMITQGRTAILRLEGRHEVTAALVADLDYRVHAASLSTGPVLPTAYALHQNYPNPFNPSTVIAFELPGSVETRLEVFNVAGQRVALLVDRVLPQGIHEITWDAGDLASGVYLTKLSAGDFSATRKMLLLK